MELIAIGKMLFKDLQLHIFGVLLLSYRAYARMDKRHEVDSATNALKFEHIDESMDGLKKVVEDGKKDTDEKIDEVRQEVKQEMTKTKVYLENKWEKYTSGSEKEETHKEKVRVQ